MQKKARTQYTFRQQNEIKKAFREDNYPGNIKIITLSLDVGLTEKQLRVWFQNRRYQKAKKCKTHKLLLYQQLIATQRLG